MSSLCVCVYISGERDAIIVIIMLIGLAWPMISRDQLRWQMTQGRTEHHPTNPPLIMVLCKEGKTKQRISFSFFFLMEVIVYLKVYYICLLKKKKCLLCCRVGWTPLRVTLFQSWMLFISETQIWNFRLRKFKEYWWERDLKNLSNNIFHIVWDMPHTQWRSHHLIHHAVSGKEKVLPHIFLSLSLS